MKTERITARITEEVLGSPQEHVDETLKDVIKKLKEEKDLTVLTVQEHPAEEMENKMFSAFADIEFETNSMKRVMEICFDFMPSAIEILDPAGVTMDSNDFTEMLNDLLAKQHKYSFVLNKLKTENIYMMKKLNGEIK
ncbi:hypothetical protein HOD38_04250 [archaeon]|jgi:hypothetical protein|nr:hypothetical protein [archaeon]MBT4397453.1 hypothetical protein [archaeon]MBT4440525.1 hypothetical protein [archaeon]